MTETSKTKTHTITKPILDGNDPWIVAKDDDLYYCYSDPSLTIDKTGINNQDKIYISKINAPWSIYKTNARCVWTAPIDTEYSNEIWAPELHHFDGKWYIYFTACGHKGDATHRNFVLESFSDDPFSEYHVKNKLDDGSNSWGIDLTVLEFKGGRYCIWSGWENSQKFSQNLYIAKMSNPWTMSSERVLISRPEYDWEKISAPELLGGINEGPEIILHQDTISAIYSASGSWTDHYCLGQLNFVGEDPLNASHWHKSPNPVFEKTETILAPGHASFVQHDDQHWIVYHAARNSGSGWDRIIYTQSYCYNEDNRPIFGKPGVPVQRVIGIN